jgi:hypothetical protein
MKHPSNRRPSWLWLPVKWTCGGLLFVGISASFVMAQESPNASPPAAAVQPAVPPSVTAPEFLPRLSPNEQKILSALNEPTEVAFNDNPLEEALNYLKELHNIEIWIDKAALQADGVATDQQVSLNFTVISLRSVLRLVLEPLALTFVIEADVLKVTTQKAADKTILTRIYPVGDLFSSREEAEELVESLICGLGLGQKGKEGPRPLAVSVPSGAIIARLSRPQNDQLLQLLRDLREAKALVPNRSYELIEPLHARTRPGNSSSSPIPLDEFSPGSESRVVTPRLRVHGKPELSKPIETPVSPKTTQDR